MGDIVDKQIVVVIVDLLIVVDIVADGSYNSSFSFAGASDVKFKVAAEGQQCT